LDLPLAGVTLQLFTDPNDDGNPADGALVQVTATDVNGYYELLNLDLGAYVIVETDLPGYSSTAPVDNRLAIDVLTLNTNANQDFFDYQPSPTSIPPSAARSGAMPTRTGQMTWAKRACPMSRSNWCRT